MKFSPFACVALLLGFAPLSARAAGKTNIYIDQIPLYTELASCAQDRISAIIRAQFSGCGDDLQLTSFSCFCIDSSTQFKSIIATAVEEKCVGKRTATVTTSQGVPTDVVSALELFSSYCSKSTQLEQCMLSYHSNVYLVEILHDMGGDAHE
jgi:hypothetical protein